MTTFTARKPRPRAFAARATASASMSMTSAPVRAASSVFRAARTTTWGTVRTVPSLGWRAADRARASSPGSAGWLGVPPRTRSAVSSSSVSAPQKPTDSRASGLNVSAVRRAAAAARRAPTPLATKTREGASWKRRPSTRRGVVGIEPNVGASSWRSAAITPSFMAGPRAGEEPGLGTRDRPPQRPWGGALRHHLDGVVQLLAELDAASRGDRRLESGVHHAALAAGLAGGRAVLVPVGLVDQVLEGRMIGVAQHVAGSLPAFGRPGRVAPGGAGQLEFALEEVEVELGIAEPLLLDQAEQPLEALDDLLALEEEIAAGLVEVVARRRDDAVEAEVLHDVAEELGDLLDVGLCEHRRVAVDPVAPVEGHLARVDRLLEATGALRDVVVRLLHAVQVDGEGHVGRGLDLVEEFRQEQGVRAQDDVLAALDDAVDDLVDVGVDEGLAAADGHHRRVALVDGLEALLDAEPLGLGAGPAVGGAAQARQIAGVQGFQHHHDGELVLAAHALAHEIAGHPEGHGKRLSHSVDILSLASPASSKRSVAGRRSCGSNPSRTAWSAMSGK